MTYSCSVKTVSRSGGRSATAAAAYRNAELIDDQRTGERHDYSRRSGVESVQWFAPDNAPQMTSAELWNMAEAAEKRKDSVVAREVLVAIPHELNQEQRTDLVKRVSQNLADRYGVAGTAAIHEPDREGDQRNWHAHILMTTRQLDPATGQLGAKTKALDNRMTTGPEEVKWIRQMVEQEGNAALQRAGHAARLDCRSLAEQGIDRAPTTHEGPRVTAIRRECEREQRAPLGECEVIELNDARRLPPLAELRAEAQQLQAEIIDLEKHRQERDLRRQLAEQQRILAGPRPSCIRKAKEQRQAVEQRQQEARQWHQEHPVQSKLSSWFGVQPRADREAAAALQAYKESEARQQAQKWQQEQKEAQQRLQEARQQLLATPSTAEAVRRLDAASEALKRADGRAVNRLTWADRDEQAVLHQERRAIEESRRAIEEARQRIPTPAEAKELEQRAGQHLERMERWEQIEQQRRAEAQQEMERRIAEKLKDRPEPAPSQSGPRHQGPRLR